MYSLRAYNDFGMALATIESARAETVTRKSAVKVYLERFAAGSDKVYFCMDT